MKGTTNKPFEILIVEDNDDDVALAKEAFKQNGITCNLNRTKDGIEAMDYLNKNGEFNTAKIPDIILLDLNMPKKDGWEVLAEIKNDKKLKSIPVVILTTSERKEDVVSSYEKQASCFVTKPVDLDEFVNVVKTIKGFWFKTVTLPDDYT